MGLIPTTRRWMSGCLLAAMAAGLPFADTAALAAQSRRVEPAEFRCQSVLGVGVDTVGEVVEPGKGAPVRGISGFEVGMGGYHDR